MDSLKAVLDRLHQSAETRRATASQTFDELCGSILAGDVPDETAIRATLDATGRTEADLVAALESEQHRLDLVNKHAAGVQARDQLRQLDEKIEAELQRRRKYLEQSYERVAALQVSRTPLEKIAFVGGQAESELVTLAGKPGEQELEIGEMQRAAVAELRRANGNDARAAVRAEIEKLNAQLEAVRGARLAPFFQNPVSTRSLPNHG